MIWLLESLLTTLARVYLRRFRPMIVAVTGNAGKTTTREAIAAVLATKYRVRSSIGNLNHFLGIPLVIFGGYEEEYYRRGGTIGFWFHVLTTAPFKLFQIKDYPQILVLEYGADAPGDIKKLVRTYPPHISVVTQVGEIPVHVEFFASPQHLANEKMQIIKHLKPTDHAILNYDDQTVLDMRSHTQAQIHTFGAGEGADAQVSDIKSRMDGNLPLGLRFNIALGGSAMPAVINGTLGRGIATASAAAVMVGKILAIGLADAISALLHLRPPAGRMRILRGIKETVILDDSYNASPAAMQLALETVKSIPASRRVLVLGDMLELGEHTIRAHQALGDTAGEAADILVCVGERMRFAVETASAHLDKSNIHWFHDSTEAAPKVQELIKPGDLILVKASQGKRMERIVKEIMAEPDRADELLVRQSKKWLSKT